MKIYFSFLLLVFLFFPYPAHAYIDPASGSMILQAIVVGFVTGWFAFKNWIIRAINFIKNIFTKK